MTTNNDIFEVATRSKVRFAFKGSITVEDLWDLPLTSLDAMFKTLNVQVKNANEESLLDVRTRQDKELVLKVELIKHVVKTKLEEKALRLVAKEKKEKKQRLLEIISSKQDEDLQGKSVEELSKMIDELD